MWLISQGLSLVKRASPLTEGPPASLGPQLPKAIGATTYFPFQIFVLGRRKTQGKRAVSWTIHFGKQKPGPIFCLPSK